MTNRISLTRLGLVHKIDHCAYYAMRITSTATTCMHWEKESLPYSNIKLNVYLYKILLAY